MKNSLRIQFVVSMLCLLLFAVPALCQTLHVATNGDNTDGQTWATAYITIQAAVNAAGDHDTILVGSSGTGHGDGLYPETVDITKRLIVESESGYETTTVGYAGSTDHIFYVPPDTDGVTIRGFSIFGATGSSDWQRGGIYLNEADHCTIENNRCGWDVDKQNKMGIYLGAAHHNILRNNLCNQNTSRGIFLWGASHNIIADNTCDQNIRGIDLYVGNNYNFIARNQCNLNDYYGIVIDNSSENAIAYNRCDGTVRFDGLFFIGDSYYNAAIGNVLSNNRDGFYLNTAYYLALINNTTLGNRRKDISLSTDTKYGHFYHNHFAGSFDSKYRAENDWSTPTEMCYLYNPAVKSTMGNYYANMDHTDTDGDGITDAIMDLPGAEHDDQYPLVSEPNQYAVQTWYVASADGMSMDPAGVPGWVEITGDTSHIWTADTAAQAGIDFTAIDPNDGWTGRIRFNDTINGSEITIQIGSADTDGDNFTAGSQVFLADSLSMFTFETNGTSFTVPAGKTLALRVANNRTNPVSVRQGAFSYISAPTGTSQAWPGTITGDIAGEIGVDLVDFAHMAKRWGQTDCAETNDCQGADLDRLGSVDIEDLRILGENWLMGK